MRKAVPHDGKAWGNIPEHSSQLELGERAQAQSMRASPPRSAPAQRAQFRSLRYKARGRHWGIFSPPERLRRVGARVTARSALAIKQIAGPGSYLRAQNNQNEANKWSYLEHHGVMFHPNWERHNI